MSPATLRQKLFALIDKQLRLQQALARSRDKMIQGSLFQWYTACRKGNCKCTRGEKHGPFLYAAVTVKGKTIQRYVGKQEDQGLVKKLKAYREFRKQRRDLKRINHRIEPLWEALQESLMEGRLR